MALVLKREKCSLHCRGCYAVLRCWLSAHCKFCIALCSRAQQCTAESHGYQVTFCSEVFVGTALHVCEQRDVKGLYKKARAGEIKGFTGIDSTCEKPEGPKSILQTDTYDVPDCVQKVVEFLQESDIVPVDASYEVNELFMLENKLSLAKTDVEPLPALKINEIHMQRMQVLAEGWAAR